MRRLGLLAFLAATACFNPDDPEGSGGTETSSSGSGSTSPSTSASTTDDATSAVTSTTDDPTTTTNPTEDTTDTVADSSSTGTTPACGGEEVCVESAPEGWEGPGLRVTADSGPPPSCGMEYSVQGPGGFTGAMAPPAQCECSCEFPATLECADASVVYYSGEMCDSAEGGNTIADGQCGTFFIGQGVNSVTAHGNPDADWGCTPALDETIPPVGPTEPTALCLPDSFGNSCGDGATCLPAATLNTYCISQPGEVPCPADSAYDDRTVIYGGFEDDRACGDCSCGAADVECGGFIRAYDGNNCTGGNIMVPLDDSCVQSISDSFNNARYFAGAATGTCPSGGGESMGGVTPQQPTTLCCADF